MNTTPMMTSTPSPTPTMPPPNPACSRISIDYAVAPAIICVMCFIFGLVYTFFGYRFFKATMFVTGFIFGCVLTYLICLEEQLLPIEGKIGVALAAGILCGLITMLVQHVGLFMTGLNLGILLAVGALVILEQFYHPNTKWIPVGTLFGAGLVFALMTLYFQRSFTILGTTIFGAALMVTAVDYYIEMFLMLNYVWDIMKAEPVHSVCWFSWIILGCWPFLFFVGVIIQCRVTGRGQNHHQVEKRRRQAKPANVVPTKKKQKVNLEQARQEDRRSAPRTAPQYPQLNRYTHLYQVRRSNGDVISRSYIQSIQHKLSPQMRNLTQIEGEDPSQQSGLTRLP